MPSPPRPVPDDDKANSPVLYVAVGLASIVLVVVVLALMILPPALAAGFVIRGGRSGQPLLKWMGIALFLLWFGGFCLVGRRVMAPRPANEADRDRDGDRDNDGDGGGDSA